MISPDEILGYWQQMRPELPEVRKVVQATDAAELANIMQEHKQFDNVLLLSIDPDYEIAGGQDNYMWGNTCGLFILEKTDYREGTAAYREMISRTRIIGKKIAENLVRDMIGAIGMRCNFLAWLDVESIELSPVRLQNSCNGFYLQFYVKSRP